MEPVRRCHKSHFFKTLNIEGKTWYTPCAPSDPGAQSMSIMQVPQNSLKPPDITADDFYKILDTAKPSVSPEDLVKQEEFTNAFGMEG